MARPHAALIELAAARWPIPRIADGEALLDSAAEHRMSGLLWSAVTAGDIELPANSERLLAWRELLTRRHHRKLWEAMEELSGRFHRAGLGVATLKGVTAEARWYGRMGERPTLDVDLLVSPTDLDRLEECAALIQPDHPLRGQLDEAVGRGGLQSLDLWGPGHVAIDLHFDSLKLGVPTLQADSVWSRSVPYPTPNGVEIRVLDAETSLILFLFHVLKDRFSSLIGLVDIVRIVEQEDLDWDFIDRFVGTEGLEVPAYLTLDAVFGALGLEAPAVPAVSGWREKAWRRLWPDDVRLGGRIGLARHHRRQMWLPFLGRGRVGEAISSAVSTALPPRVLMDYYHPDTRGPYVLRLVVGRWRSALERRGAVKQLS